jgi:hypothetical protein
MKTWATVAWVVLAGAWVGLVIHMTAEQGSQRLCAPEQPVVIRLGQPKGATEVGVVYMDFQAARTARDGLDQWLRQYGKCP